MKKIKIRQTRGITLMALGITVTVLSILAGVTIAMAHNNGLVEKTEQAKEMYEQAAEAEEQYETELKNRHGKNDNYAKSTENSKILTIQDNKTLLLKDFIIYGNSVQDTDTYGEPSPDNPVEIQSVGDLVTQGEYAGKYKIPVKVMGKNLKNWQKKYAEFSNTFYNGFANIWDYKFQIPKYMFGNTLTYSAHFDLTNAKNKDGGVVYGSVRVWIYDENDSVLRVVFGTEIHEGENGISKVTFTIPTNAKYIGLGLSVRAYDEKIMVSNPQIEIGSQATPYEQYVEENCNIYLNEPLRKIGNDVDYIDFKNQKVVRNIYAKHLKSSLGWSDQYYPVILTYLNQKEYAKYAWDTNVMTKYSNKTYLRITNSGGTCIGFGNCDTHWKFATISDLKTWLDEHNDLIAYYPLKTPIEETIELPDIPLFEGYTTIQVDTTTAPSLIEVIY